MATETEPVILQRMSAGAPFGATPDTRAFDLRAPAAARSTASSSRLGLVGLAGILATGLVLSMSAANTNVLLPDSARPVPDWMAGLFGHGGPYLPSGVLLLLLSLAFASYVVVVRAADRLTPRAVLVTVAGLVAVVLLAPPLFSTDVFSYQEYARMWATFHINPYTHGPYANQLDTLYGYIGAKWIYTPSVYGPLFTMLSGLWAGASIGASEVTFKLIAAISCLGTVVLLWHGARLRGLNPVRGVALFALNPLVVLYGVGGGHNDLLMVVFTTAGLYALLAHRERTSGAMIAIGTAVKLTGGLLLPFALASGVALGAPRRRRALLVGAGAVAIAVSAAGVVAFGDWPVHLIGTLTKVQGEGDWHSIPGFITTVLGLGGIGHVVGILLGAVFFAMVVWLLRRVWRGQMDWVDGAAWATAAMLLTASSVLPWYVSWLLPLVALCTDRRLWRVALVLTGVVMFTTMLGYIPHGTSIFGLGLVP